MKKHYSEQYIGRLIDRFMAGETTLDEEMELGEYFRTARSVPAEWDTYRQMFEYFDCGMNRPKHKLLRRISLWRVAAAVFVLAFVLTATFLRGTFNKSVPVDEPFVAMVTVEHKSMKVPKSVGENPSDSERTTTITVPKKEVIASSKPKKRRTSPSDSYRQPSRHADVDDSYKSLTVLPYDEIVKQEEQKMRDAYNEMKEAEYMNRQEMGECCMLVENIDGYYEVKKCVSDIILL